MPPPDWKRLGARFGVADVCVPFAEPGEVYLHGDAEARLLAEHVVALREDAWGVRVQTISGLVLEIKDASLAHVERDSACALIEKRVRVRVQGTGRRRVKDSWFGA